ncbi:hypothetical protein FTX61_18185 [Nitriliruptoraceae bacterium ZYF776]|nr:hypothetical protein [Profundirhabdus halotolerans]
MPRQQTSDRPATVPVDGATLVIEATTAEAAIAQVHEQLGGDARILEARRVLRGGIGGFFAREVVELHAAPGGDLGDGAAPAAAPEVAPAASPRGSVDDVLADAIAAARRAGAIAGADTVDPGPVASPASAAGRLLAAEETPEVDFATFLRQQLVDDAPALATAGAPVAAVAPADLDATAPAWLASALAPAPGGGVVDPAATRPAPRRVDAATLLREHEAANGVDPGAGPSTDAVAVAEPAVAVAEPVAVAAPLAAPPAEAADDHAVVTPPSTTAAPDVIDDAATTDADGPAWSASALIGLGLPAGLVRGLAVEAPGDDVAWTASLAAAIRPLCRPLPTGNAVLAGPRARTVAGATGVPVVATGQPLRSRAAVVAATVGGAASRTWLDKVRRTRWLHLVVGGRGWRELLASEPLAVSWATADDLPEALRLASELGLVLGSGPVPGGTRRARPLDVALAVRDLLPVHGGAA